VSEPLHTEVQIVCVISQYFKMYYYYYYYYYFFLPQVVKTPGVKN